MPEAPKRFVIGIGNPDGKYQGTRHNVGFEALDAISGLEPEAKLKWSKESRWQAMFTIYQNTWLVKPLTYVNNTGGSVAAIVRECGAAPENILVVCDDVNLSFGKMRLRASGSAGGHHGLESVIRDLNSENFPRLRIGVGNDRMPKNLEGFVLEPFLPEERERVPEISQKAARICTAWAQQGFEAALNQLSRLQA